MAEAFLSKEQPGGLSHKVVILLMSDGMCCYPDKTCIMAKRIKENYPVNKLKIATALFQGIINHQDEETETAIKLLEEIASTEMGGMTCFLHTTSPEALRKFFEASSGVA